MFKRQSAVRTKQNKPRRIIDPRKRMVLFQVFIGLGILILLATVLTGVWYGTRISNLTLVTINVSGGETISHQLVREKAESVLAGSYLGIIPRRFAWFYPHEDVLGAVGSVERVKNPVVTRVSGTELQVAFLEYQSFALWCKENSDECLLIDNTGFAFARAPKLTGGAFVRYYTLGRPPVVGETIVAAPPLLTMNEFISKVSANTKFAIASVEIDSAKDVFYRISGGGEIKATLSMTADEVFSNLQAVLSAEEFANLAPGNFQYIDLRFGQKVFVNDSLLPTATSTASTTNGGVELPTALTESATSTN